MAGRPVDADGRGRLEYSQPDARRVFRD